MISTIATCISVCYCVTVIGYVSVRFIEAAYRVDDKPIIQKLFGGGDDE